MKKLTKFHGKLGFPTYDLQGVQHTMQIPFLYRLWVATSFLALPIMARQELRKVRAAGFSDDRAREKLGYATISRTDECLLVWFHAASVGESLSVLALITQLGKTLPDARFLITSGTATSATLLGKRLPPRTDHQFAPLDAPGPLRRFLAHWRPDAVIFVESEIWPQMLRRTFATGARMALVNARLSKRSLERWNKKPAFARYLFDVFELILTQNDIVAEGLTSLGVPPHKISRGVNLKSMSPPLPIDKTTVAEIALTLGKRPVWVASSTHPGEEETVIAAHKVLCDQWPDLCLILAPRHPDRGPELYNMISAAGLGVTQRSAGETADNNVYLADTLGELGAWYDLTDIVFLGGSLMPVGGHNPYEVAQAGAITLSGPNVTNFAETFVEMYEAGAALEVADAQTLATQVAHFLNDSAACTSAQAAARHFAASTNDQLDAVAQRLIDQLDLVS